MNKNFFLSFLLNHYSTATTLKRHTALTRPMTLSQGEVTNSYHEIEIPKGPIAVYRFDADVVEKDEEGNIIPVLLTDAYLHHHVVGSFFQQKEYEEHKHRWTPMKSHKISRSVGFGAGTESRGTPQEFPYPYAFLTVPGEDAWVANVHIINTRGMNQYNAHHCLECPCIHENDYLAEGVNADLPWNMCNAKLVNEGNPSCFPDTYIGGLRCCEDQMICLPHEQLSEEERSTYYLRYTIEYAEVIDDQNVPLYVASCCDATGNLTSTGAIEYDIPACDLSIDKECIHRLSTRQKVNGGRSLFTLGERVPDHESEIEILFAVGHQHRGGIGLALYNDQTNELICESKPIYGNGTEVGNEKDMIVAMTTCHFDPPLRMKSSDIVRIDANYDSTEAHTGVMSLFYVAIADVVDDQTELLHSVKSKSFFRSALYFFGIVGTGLAGYLIFVNLKRKRGYEPLIQQ